MVVSPHATSSDGSREELAFWVIPPITKPLLSLPSCTDSQPVDKSGDVRKLLTLWGRLWITTAL
jgi:hypothetical protein